MRWRPPSGSGGRGPALLGDAVRIRSGGSDALKGGAVPLCQTCGRVVGAVDERLDRILWGRRSPHRLVRKNELSELFVIVGRVGLYAALLEPGWWRHGVGVEGRLQHGSAPRPEPMADHLVRIGVPHERRAVARRRG